MNSSLLCRIALVAAAAVMASGCGSKCSPSNCGGCCSASGICEAPTANFCGLGGNACTSCAALEGCVNGACAFESGTTGTVAGSSGASTNQSISTAASNSNSSAGSTGTHSAGTVAGSSGTMQGSATAGSTTTGLSHSSSSGAGSTTIGTSGSTTATTSVGTSSSATATSNGSTGIASSSSGTTVTTNSSGSTGSSGLPLCSQCTANGQCASTYCNTAAIPGFCDTLDMCVPTGGTPQQDCSPYACVNGDCACPAGAASSSSSGSSGTTACNCAAKNCNFIGEVCDPTLCQCVPITSGSSSSGTVGSSGTTGSISEPGSDGCMVNSPILPLNQPVTGSTQTSNNNYQADGNVGDTCFPATTLPSGTCQGPDVAYRFTPAASGTYVFTATPDATYDLALVVFQGTCQNPIASCVLGADVQAQGGTETGSASLTAGTEYFVVVDGYATDAGNDGFDYGTYTLEVSTPPACLSGDMSQLSGPGTNQSEGGDTASSTLTYSDACTGNAASSFVAYSFTTTQTTDFSATVSTTDTGYQPMLALGTGCSPFTEDTCSSAAAAGGSTTITQTSLPAGTYTLLVGGVGTIFGTATSGPFTLNVSLGTPVTPPSNNTCSGAIPLSLTAYPDGGMSTTLDVNNLGALNVNIGSVSGTCAGSGRGGNLVYSVTFANPVASLSAVLTPGADGGLNEPEVSIQKDPCYENMDAGVNPSELACNNNGTGGPTGVASASLRAGTYYIWVGELSTGVPGEGTLQVTVP